MKILVIHNAESGVIHRLVGNPGGQLPDEALHVGPGEACYVATTLEPDPKSVEQLQAEVHEHMANGGAA